MILGEMTLLVVAVLVLSGASKGITARLRMNDYVTAFYIFVIVILNVRGGVKLTRDYSLALGSVFSLFVAIYTLIRRSEKASDVFFALLSAVGCAGIAFAYTLHFSSVFPLDKRLLATLLSLLLGLWCAFSARRTFSFLGVDRWIRRLDDLSNYLSKRRKNRRKLYFCSDVAQCNFRALDPVSVNCFIARSQKPSCRQLF